MVPMETEVLSDCSPSLLALTGGLDLAIEGPSKAEISCIDNKDGTCTVTYLPTLPGDYSILVKYNDKHIPGSPFTAKITGRGTLSSLQELLLGGRAVPHLSPSHPPGMASLSLGFRRSQVQGSGCLNSSSFHNEEKTRVTI